MNEKQTQISKQIHTDKINITFRKIKSNEQTKE